MSSGIDFTGIRPDAVEPMMKEIIELIQEKWEIPVEHATINHDKGNLIIKFRPSPKTTPDRSVE